MHIALPTTENKGSLLQKYCDRPGRWNAVLFKSVSRSGGRCDSPESLPYPLLLPDGKYQKDKHTSQGVCFLLGSLLFLQWRKLLCKFDYRSCNSDLGFVSQSVGSRSLQFEMQERQRLQPFTPETEKEMMRMGVPRTTGEHMFVWILRGHDLPNRRATPHVTHPNCSETFSLTADVAEQASDKKSTSKRSPDICVAGFLSATSPGARLGDNWAELSVQVPSLSHVTRWALFKLSGPMRDTQIPPPPVSRSAFLKF